MAIINFYSEHPTKAEADRAASDMRENFPPQGYETSCRVYQTSTGAWAMSGWRSSSCD